MSVETPGGLPFTDAGKAAFADVKNQYDPTGFCLVSRRDENRQFPVSHGIRPNAEPGGYSVRVHADLSRDSHRRTRAWQRPESDLSLANRLGRWEGDTLVVDVIGFNEKSWLDPAGHPHSDALHLIGALPAHGCAARAYEVTIDDPKMYTKPWKSTIVFTRKPDWEIIEYSCDENNKDRDQHHFQPGPSFPILPGR